jgi:hypothetical protein
VAENSFPRDRVFWDFVNRSWQQAAQKPVPLPLAIPVGPSAEDYFLARLFMDKNREKRSLEQAVLKEMAETNRDLLRLLVELSGVSKSPRIRFSSEALEEAKLRLSSVGKDNASQKQEQKTEGINESKPSREHHADSEFSPRLYPLTIQWDRVNLSEDDTHSQYFSERKETKTAVDETTEAKKA